jgi:uncharacterized protein
MLRNTLIAVVLLAILGVVAVWIAGSIALGPTGQPWRRVTPPAGVEEVAFTATDGVELKGWWWQGRDSTRAVVLLHGFRSNRLQMFRRMQWLHDAGYASLIFDFRGCGESGGTGTLGFAERLDVGAALRFVRDAKHVPNAAIVGQGMGAAAAVMAVDQWGSVRGAVLERVYDDLEDAIRVRVGVRIGSLEPAVSPLFLWQVRPRFGFSPQDLSPVRFIGKAGCPVLLAYGGKDDTLSVSMARSLFAAGPSPTTLWSLQRAGHEDLNHFDPKAYQEKIGGFLNETLGPPAQEGKP